MNKKIDELNVILNKHFKRSKKSIISIGFSVKNKAYTYDFNSPKEKNMSFGLGSISKTFISTYICELVHQGKIDLNNPVSHYVESNPKIKYPKLIDLLTHTSGYHAFIPFVSSMKTMITNGFNRKNIYQKLDKEWLKRSIKRVKPLKPGKYRYSDYNYAIIGYIIESIEKAPLIEVMCRYIIEVLLMPNTFYATENYTKSDNYSWRWEDDNPYLAAGGLFSNVNDLMVFLDYQSKNKEKLRISHKRYFQTFLNKNVYTGFSWSSFHNSNHHWHIGGQGRYRSYVLFDTKREISVVVLATVDINVQHVNRLGSIIFSNVKKDHHILNEYLANYKNRYVHS